MYVIMVLIFVPISSVVVFYSDYNYRVHCKDLRRIIGLINVYIESTPIITYKCIALIKYSVFRAICRLKGLIYRT